MGSGEHEADQQIDVHRDANWLCAQATGASNKLRWVRSVPATAAEHAVEDVVGNHRTTGSE